MSKKYRTWEMIKALTENPKLRFKNNDGHTAFVSNTLFSLNYREHTSSSISHNIRLVTEGHFMADEWELIQEPVDFMTAAQAYAEGKTIRCEGVYYTQRYEPTRNESPIHEFGYLIKNSSGCITTSEILNGKWYVEE